MNEVPPEFALFLKDFDERALEVRAGLVTQAERIRAVYDRSIAAVDRSKVQALQAWVRDELVPRWRENPAVLKLGAMPHKYLDLPQTFRDKARWVVAAEMDREAPQRVLDLGVGGGAFAFQVQCFGHEVVAIDLEDEIFSRLLEALGIHRIVQRIEPRRPLQLEGTFDAVTAIQITFNKLGDETQATPVFWERADWKGLLTDLASRLRRPGRILLSLNRHALPGREVGDADQVMTWLSELGGRVNPFQYSVLFELQEPQAAARQARRLLRSLGVETPVTRQEA